MRVRRRAGFTLIELMVVIVILGGLVALVGPNVFKHLRDGRMKTARLQLSHIGQALDGYRMEHKRLPTALAELTQATESSPEPPLARIPLDPWDREYEYRPDGARYRLRCLGEDGQPGTADDLIWPDEAA